MIEYIEIKKSILENKPEKFDLLLSKLKEDDSLNQYIEYACENGFFEIVRIFFKKFNKNKIYQSGFLQGASKNGHIKIVKLLLKQNNYENQIKEKSFLKACEFNHTEIALLILETGINHTENDFRELSLIVSNNNIELFNIIINLPFYKKYLNLNLEEKHIEKQKRLIYSLKNSLLVASSFHLNDIIKIILKNIELFKYFKIDVSSSIERAALNNGIETLKLLLKYDFIDPSANQNKTSKNLYNNKNIEGLILLWQDERVKKSLKEQHLDIFNFLIRHCNIKNF
jgi:hypothetical protein